MRRRDAGATSGAKVKSSIGTNLQTKDAQVVGGHPCVPHVQRIQELEATLAEVERRLTICTRERSHERAQLQQLQREVLCARTRAAQAEHQARHDALTGLPNRRLLFTRLTEALAEAERNNSLVGVVLLDLDGFKLVNDRLGHATGDAVLVRVAQALLRCVRAGDTVARLGGDEFALVLPRVQAPETVAALAGDIRSRVRWAQRSEDNAVPVAASVGVAMYPTHGESCAMLLQHADQAMYTSRQRVAASGAGRRFGELSAVPHRTPVAASRH
jgi:diguanylate cyclase (GGDEF)-like protein